MVSRVAGAVRSKRIVLLIEVAVLREWPQGLIDRTGETRIGERNAGGNCIGACSARQAARIHGQLTAERQELGIHLVGNYVQRGEVGSLGTNIGDTGLQVLGDLPLHIEVPGLDVGGASAVTGDEYYAAISILRVRREWT